MILILNILVLPLIQKNKYVRVITAMYNAKITSAQVTEIIDFLEEDTQTVDFLMSLSVDYDFNRLLDNEILFNFVSRIGKTFTATQLASFIFNYLNPPKTATINSFLAYSGQIKNIGRIKNIFSPNIAVEPSIPEPEDEESAEIIENLEMVINNAAKLSVDELTALFEDIFILNEIILDYGTDNFKNTINELAKMTDGVKYFEENSIKQALFNIQSATGLLNKIPPATYTRSVGIVLKLSDGLEFKFKNLLEVIKQIPFTFKTLIEITDCLSVSDFSSLIIYYPDIQKTISHIDKFILDSSIYKLNEKNILSEITSQIPKNENLISYLYSKI